MHTLYMIYLTLHSYTELKFYSDKFSGYVHTPIRWSHLTEQRVMTPPTTDRVDTPLVTKKRYINSYLPIGNPITHMMVIPASRINDTITKYVRLYPDDDEDDSFLVNNTALLGV